MSATRHFGFRAASKLVLSFAPLLFHGQVPHADVALDARHTRTEIIPTSRQVSTAREPAELEIGFEANRGQAAAPYKFLSRGRDQVFLLGSSETALYVGTPHGGGSVRMRFLRAKPNAALTGRSELPGKVNDLTGAEPRSWHTNIPTYAEVKYEGLYPGVDLVYFGQHGTWAYRFTVAPGSDPNAVALAFEGTDPPELDGTGTLSMRVAGGRLNLDAPQVHQGTGESRVDVGGGYLSKSSTEVGLWIGTYDATKPLVIEGVLSATSQKSRLPGAAEGRVGVAVDTRGCAYVADIAVSPRTTPGDDRRSGSSDVVVAKLNATGSAFAYTTYLGGSGDDGSAGIAVDAEGSAYVTGLTRSTNFPLVGAWQPVLRGFSDAFVTKLSPDGSALIYSTYLGGKADDAASDIAVDASRNAYVTGRTNSGDFPTTARAVQPTPGESGDAFLAKVDARGETLVYSTFIGGSGDDASFGVAVNSEAEAYLTGRTDSADFPVWNAYQPAPGDSSDAFVAKLSADGSEFVYATYLGGRADDAASDLVLDADANAIVTGRTTSSDFPTTAGVAQPSLRGAGDAFVTKLDASGRLLTFSTYVGGSGDDASFGVAVDSDGAAYLTGTSSSTDFPILNAYQPALLGSSDAFLVKLAADGSRWVYATYGGGDSSEAGSGIAVDSARNVSVVGTATTMGDFPFGKLQPAGGVFAFVARFSDAFSPASPTYACPGTINFDNSAGTCLWQTATNWDLDRLPDPTDDVCIPAVVPNGGCTSGVTLSSGIQSIQSLNALHALIVSAGTLTVAAPSQLTDTFTLSGSGGLNENGGVVFLGLVGISAGTLNGNGDIEMRGPFTLSGSGTLMGTGDVGIADSFVWTGGSMSGRGTTNANGGIAISGALTKTLKGSRSLTNSGTATWSQSSNGWLQIGEGSVLTNTGIWDSQSDAILYDGNLTGSSSFVNEGTFKKSAGTATSTEVRIPLTNSGTVSVQTGTLNLTDGSSGTGAWTASSGATLQFGTGTHDLNSGSSIGGVGRVLVVSPAAVNVNAGCTYDPLGTTELASGSLSFNSGVSATTATFNQSGGTLGGSGSLTVPGTLNWTGGEQSGGGTTTATTVLTISGAATKTLSGARVLTNTATATWTQTGTGYLQVGEGSVINNTGTWDAQSDAILWNANMGGSSTFVNSGTLRKTGGSAITEVRINLVNSGTVSVQSGTMQLTFGSSSTGAFTGSTGATLQFGTGTHTLNLGASVGGLERVLVTAPAAVNVNAGANYNALGSTEIQSGSLYFASGVSAVSATLNQSGGAIGGPGLLSVPGVFNWTGGEQLGGGTTTAGGVLSISGGATKTLHGARVLTNTATATWTQTGTGYLQVGEGSVINNTGTWDAQSDAILWNANMAGSSSFVNAGTFRKVGGSAVTEVRIQLTNSGTVVSQSGTLSFTSPSTPNGYVQTAGLTQPNGGILLSTSPFYIQHGTLGGTGTITGSILSGGTLSPGSSPASLAVTGSYIQASGGSYNVELGGTAAGSQYDQVNLTGSVTLAGTLHVSLINGYVPSGGDTFTIMTFASRSGSFNVTELPTLAAGLDWCLTYGNTSLVLAVVGSDPEADCDLDGVPNGLDCGPNDPSAFTVPSEITGVRFLANRTTMLWDSAAASAGSGTRYDIARGLLNELPVGPGQGDASEVCGGPALSNASMADLSIPSAGQGFWYLVRGHNDCGSGTYGNRSNGQERLTSICP